MLTRGEHYLLATAALWIAVAGAGGAQPTIAKQRIPRHVPFEVRYRIETLYSSKPWLRVGVAGRLGRMGREARAAVPFLMAMLHDAAVVQQPPAGGETTPGLEAALAVARILGAGSAAAARLATGLKHREFHVRAHAALALAHIRNRQAVGPLIAALQRRDWALGCWAVCSLWRLRDERAVGPLLSILQDRGRENCLRGNAALGLGEMHARRAVVALIAALGEGDLFVQCNAAEALGEIGDPRAVMPLIDVLGAEDGDLLMKAAGALGKIGDRRAIEPLIALLGHEDEFVRAEAASALKAITGRDLGLSQAKWRKWWQSKRVR